MNIWARLGVSVALAAIFYIASAEILPSTSFFEAHKWHLCVMVLTCGLILWSLGLVINARLARKTAAVQEPGTHAEEGEQEDGPFLLVNLSYWGPMLVVFSIILAFIYPKGHLSAQIVAARTSPISLTNVPAPQSPSKALEIQAPHLVADKPAGWPSLKLQGLTYRKANASVL